MASDNLRKTQFKWKKFGNYAIYANGYSIAKYKVKDTERYGLWSLIPNALIGFYKTPQEAKDEAILHYEQQPAIPNRQDKVAMLVRGMGTGYKKEKEQED
jgi:hypothetical protein